jgi:predicted alpha/beta hydrolase family esterase
MQYVIFHGTMGSSQANWFPWLKKELEARAHTVISPNMPVDKLEGFESPPIQTLESWTKYFESDVLPKLKKHVPICFIGHSIGPVFILHLLEKYDLHIRKAIFVAPFYKPLPNLDFPYDVINKSFYNPDPNWTQIKSKIDASHVLYSDNDPYVPADDAKDFAEKINAQQIMVADGGHLNSDFGYDKFREVLDICLS